MYTGDIFGNVYRYRLAVSGASAFHDAELIIDQARRPLPNTSSSLKSKSVDTQSSPTDPRVHAVASLCSSWYDGSLFAVFKNKKVITTSDAFCSEITVPFEPYNNVQGVRHLQNNTVVVLGKQDGAFAVVSPGPPTHPAELSYGNVRGEMGSDTDVLLLRDTFSPTLSSEGCAFQVCVGGKGRNLCISDSEKLLWQTRANPGVHVTSLAHAASSPFVLVAATAKKVLHLYDTRDCSATNAPQLCVPTDALRGRPVTLSLVSEHIALVGDQLGEVALFDLRKANRTTCQSRLKAGTGAVVGMDVVTVGSEPYAFTLYRDRYVRFSKATIPVHPITGNLVWERLLPVTPLCVAPILSAKGRDDEAAFLKRHIAMREKGVEEGGKRATAERDHKGGGDPFSRAARAISKQESDALWDSLELLKEEAEAEAEQKHAKPVVVDMKNTTEDTTTHLADACGTVAAIKEQPKKRKRKQ